MFKDRVSIMPSRAALKIYIAGHRGMVGGAILRRLQARGADEIVTRTSAELDLFSHFLERADFTMHQPGNHHMETVGAHIDGREHLRRGNGIVGGGCGRHVVEILLR